MVVVNSALGKWHQINSRDGSPSLQWGTQGEPMHHSGGALSESKYVYGPVWDFVQTLPRRRILICGLGLGYLEMLTVLRLGVGDGTEVLSLEKDPTLVEAFQSFVAGGESSIHERMLQCLAGNDPRVAEQTRKRLFQAYQQGHYRIGGALVEGPWDEGYFNGICFDLFSSETSPELWREDFLRRFLQNAAAKTSIFATYAARSTLKRALGAEGFQVIPRSGFAGKRECTLATRGFDEFQI